MEWIRLDDNREQYVADGFIVIRPLRCESVSPLFCIVCRCPAPSADDRLTHNRDGCCSICSLKWADPRRDEWVNGWRPSKEEIDKELRRRFVRPRFILV